MNTKNNKRRQASQEKIEKVFIELLQAKELSEITVSEIITRTGLNRSTFYANYLDIYDLADTIREKLEADVEKLYENDIVNKYNSNDYLRLFHHIYNNQLFYKTYFKLGYHNQHKINLYDIHQADKFFGNRFIEYHMEFFKAGFNAMVKKWLDGGCKETPEEMSEILKSEYQGREVI
ncbi:MAG: TetR/AcrR family transcriptional regulator C-terminal domain-containing protein [Faecalimonas sp.]|nr:TetR/AcrR family transcriptional regulator C-terminal domain-containing protein [Faecalimonas sp.]